MDKEIIDELNAELDRVSLNESESAALRANPLLMNDLWDDVTQSLLIKQWPMIMLAQTDKALRGDTASAKFITDIVEELGKSRPDSSVVLDKAEWENKAIELRDRLELEVSAQILVELCLDKLIAMSVDNARQFFSS